MKLDDVEVVGLHAGKTLSHTGDYVLPGKDVFTSRKVSNRTTALGCQGVFAAAVEDVFTDELLTPSVVDRGIDEVDTGVQDSVEYVPGLIVGYHAASGLTSYLHRTVAQGSHLQARPSKGPCRHCRHADPPLLTR